MTSREAVRTAVVIGGLWLVFSALSTIPQIVATLPMISSGLREGDSDFVSRLLWTFIPLVIAIVLFGVLPGLYVVHSSAAWAARLVRADDQSTSIEPSLILAVGVMVFRFSLGVSGAISVAATLLSLPTVILFGGDLAATWLDFFQNAIHGALSIVAGILSFRWGSRGVLRAA